MRIRDAGPKDAAAIAAIFNEVVTSGTAIWSGHTVDATDRAAWMASRQQKGFPVLVAEVAGGAIAGFASYGEWRVSDGYRHTVEHSVYVRADACGDGIGAALLEALIKRAREQGKHVMIAMIDGDNAGSIRFHTRFGFAHAGRVSQVGAKYGRWLDVVIMQLTLDQRTDPDAVPQHS